MCDLDGVQGAGLGMLGNTRMDRGPPDEGTEARDRWASLQIWKATGPAGRGRRVSESLMASDPTVAAFPSPDLCLMEKGLGGPKAYLWGNWGALGPQSLSSPGSLAPQPIYSIPQSGFSS